MEEEIRKLLKSANKKELEELYAYLDRLVKRGKINPTIQSNECDERIKFKIEKIESCSEELLTSEEQIKLARLIGLIALVAIILGIGSIKELAQESGDFSYSFLSLTAISLASSGVATEFVAIKELISNYLKKKRLEKTIDSLNTSLDILEGRER